MDVHVCIHKAMTAPFTIHIAYEDGAYARQAAQAAFEVVDRAENALSRFRASSDISRINHATPGEWIVLSDAATECLAVAARICHETEGAFDVTVGPLLTCRRNRDGSPRNPTQADLEQARARVGMAHLEIDAEHFQARVDIEGVVVDLGGIGKGYAVDRAADSLREWDIESALVSGGGSTVYAFGDKPGEHGWPVGVGGVGNDPNPASILRLKDRALSGSGIFAKGHHVMDPKTGQPVEGKLAVWSLCPKATEADALSTAFLVMTPEHVKAYCDAHPDVAALLVLGDDEEKARLRFGDWRL